jgi:hypothetical protein
MLKLNCSFSPFSVSWHATHSHFLPEFGHHTWLTISPPKTRLMERRKSTLLQVTLWKGPRHNHHPWDISARNRSLHSIVKRPWGPEVSVSFHLSLWRGGHSRDQGVSPLQEGIPFSQTWLPKYNTGFPWVWSGEPWERWLCESEWAPLKVGVGRIT